MIRKKEFWVIFILIITLFLPRQSSAQAQGLTWSTNVAYEFGDHFILRLTVENPEPIERVTLFVQAADENNVFTETKVVAPSRNVYTEFDLEAGAIQFAPFTEVTYWWQLDTPHSELILPEESFIYEDNRFAWRSTKKDDVSVFWTVEDPSLGQIALDVVTESLPAIQSVIPIEDKLDLDIYLYPSSADLRTALQLTGRDWVGAHAHPELGVILVTAVNARTAATDLRQSIPHEMVHFFLYQSTKSNYGNIPLWFSEGLATHLESAPNPNYQTSLESAVTNQTTIPFSDLCHNFPSTDDRILLAYAQSASLVQYIQTQYGSHTLNELIYAYADGADCQSGVERVIDLSLNDLNQNWLRRVQPRSPFVLFFQDSFLWVLLLIGGFGLSSLLILFQRKD